MNFGAQIKALRIAKQLTLRQCCAELRVDPSNWSKMERNVTPPPQDEALLSQWAAYLGLDASGIRDLLDQASLARTEIPKDLASDATVLAALPAFFRAARERTLDGDRLQTFIQDIRSAHSPDPV